MNDMDERLKKIVDDFLADVKSCFDKDLQSVIMYGPAVRGESLPGKQANHFLVVVSDNTPSALAPCSAFVRKWEKNHILVPLFLTRDYIAHSLDTFPLEFMEMKNSYKVIFGEDALEKVTFKDCDVRNECEREIKGKLLHLRAEYLLHRSSQKDLVDLISRSLSTFRLVFGGALYLKKSAIPQKTEELLGAVSSQFGTDSGLLTKLYGISQGRIKPDMAEIDKLFDLYVEELDKLSAALDTFCVTEE